MKKEPINWLEESNRFDDASAYYDLYRPSYPNELINHIINETHVNSESNVLEIGAGSGKATELFVNKGLHLTCIEPGENLANLGRKKFECTNQVNYVVSRFEEWEEKENYFDLILSAQAFHWVPQPIGYKKCAKTLRPNGYLALFWNMYLDSGDQVDKDILQLSQDYGTLPLIYLNSKEDIEKRIKSNIDQINSSGYFSEPEVFQFPWSHEYNAEQYIGFIKTGNGYLSLNNNQRKEVEQLLKETINRNGGTIKRPYNCILYLTKKL